MSLPVVAIVGRPNVGKSSLFNTLSGRRTSIVEPTPGVTRDRVSAIVDIDGLFFELVDTGGHGVVDRDDLSEDVEQQIRFAIDQATFILFVVDAREGHNPLDRATAELLRRRTDAVRLIANKVDEPHLTSTLGEFTKLGYGEPIPISALNGSGKWALLEMLTKELTPLAHEKPADPVMKVALVGKRNAGKSTFINAIAGQPRVIVSEIPGTTRDSIDVRFEKDGRVLLAIDTAGVRKMNKIADDIEFYAHSRALDSIRRADVVLLLIDATEPVGQVDKRLAHTIAEEFKPVILVINKWDLAKEKSDSEAFGDYLGKVFPSLDYAPVAFTSAKDGRNIDSAIDLAASLFKQSQTRVGTGVLNQALQDAVAAHPSPARKGGRAARFYYATQIAAQPPTILLFVNDPKRVELSYERYLLNRFRDSLPFGEVPIRLSYRARRERAPVGRARSSRPAGSHNEG
jgi:GTP-binding protein